jgi:hypothetical protein
VHVGPNNTSTGLIAGARLDATATCSDNPLAGASSSALGGGGNVKVIVVIGGADAPASEQAKVELVQSRPNTSAPGEIPKGWLVTSINDVALALGEQIVLTPYVVCTE